MTSLNRIQGYGHVAVKYGLEPAIFLDSIVYWYRINRADDRNFHDGRWWTHNTVAAFDELFPWWTQKQIRRIVASCREQGALLVGNYNQDKRDRTIWYSPSDELLELYGEEVPGNCICPNGQMQEPEPADSSAQRGEALPCSTHVDTNMLPPYSPPAGDEPTKKEKKPKEPYRLDWFQAFWAIYPRKDNRTAALKAWDKLKPDRALCRLMAAGLERDKRSRQWRKDDGDYIPMASTWINQRRWENQGVDLTQLPAPRDEPDGGTWAKDPEVV